MGTTTNNTNKFNNTMVNINHYNILVNGHLANPQIDGPYIDIVKNLFNNAKLPFTAYRVNVTHYKDKNDIIHVIYIIDTDISAMANPVKTIADMDLVLGKFINWEDFINSYPSDLEYQVAGFYDYNDQLVIVFKYDI